ncbi:threonine/serine dehydratase [Streptosporangium sp. NPDC006013]|uniref:threonine ammonia-lyase n=1 Tax=Streptosporangium sp. NPDC006013 TaxID=3155596 RepID=UPI0033AFE6B7
MISIDDVRAAQTRLFGLTAVTPLLSSPTLDEVCGGRVVCKAENLQLTGSFKLRGALNHVLSLSREELAAGVIGASSGNHAQALAFAAHQAGTHAVVVVPADAPKIKVAAARALGAEVVFYVRGHDDYDALVAELAHSRGLTIFPSSNSLQVIAGGGTVALELLAHEEIDTLVVPVGGGGLAAGCAVAAKAINPAIQVIGVEPSSGDDTAASLRRGSRVTIQPPLTIADGLTHTTPAPIPFDINRTLLHEVVTVTDGQIIEAMEVAFTRLKVVVEPSGACALAAVTCGQITSASGKIGVVLSGGNVDWSTFRTLIGRTDTRRDDGLPGVRADDDGRPRADAS